MKLTKEKKKKKPTTTPTQILEILKNNNVQKLKSRNDRDI